MQNQRVLVTGGAGFIGSEVVRQLAARGIAVRAVDNLVNGKRETFEGVLSDNVELIVADIRDAKSMASLVRDVDVIFHLACLGVRHSIHSPIENQDVNASATLGLLSIAREKGVKRFVYVSTSEVYGMVHTAPIAEGHSTLPFTVYGASKLAGEAYTRAFWRTYHYPTVVLRPFNAYGPRCHHEGDSGEAIPRFMLRCLAGRPMVIFGDGKQTRDFTFVSDTAAGILAAGLSDSSVGQTINLGSGKEIEIQVLAKMIADVLGRPNAEILYTDPRPGDVIRLLSDSTKARKLLNFKTTVALREGLARLRDWYASQSKSPEELLEQEIERNWEIQERPDQCSLKTLFQSRARNSDRRKYRLRRGRSSPAGSRKAPRLRHWNRSLPHLWEHSTRAPSPAARRPFTLHFLPSASSPATKSSRSVTPISPPPTAFDIAERLRSLWISILLRSISIRAEFRKPSAKKRARFFASTRWECRAI